jgi:hypothetical protein
MEDEMDDEKLLILKMLQEGKITAEEAANLLDALNFGKDSKKQGENASEKSGGKPGRWLRVIITETSSGKSRANIRIPLGVINAGMKMGAHFTPQIHGVYNDEIFKAIQAGLTGQILDVFDDEDGEHVEVFIE